MQFLCKALDDHLEEPCGRCANCDGAIQLETCLDLSAVGAASLFLKESEIVLKPKRRVPSGAFQVYEFLTGRLARRNLSAEEGRILARWGDAGWGRLVVEGKHRGRFDPQLVTAVAEMVTSRWAPQPPVEWVTCVPSLVRPRLVADFAEALARTLGLPFKAMVRKTTNNRPQKLMENTAHRCRNLDGIFEITKDVVDRPVLLVDDVVDSGWTMTVIAALLRNAGVPRVYPLALAAANEG
jgi:ATP-dependent DNA helicase RecQ